MKKSIQKWLFPQVLSFLFILVACDKNVPTNFNPTLKKGPDKQDQLLNYFKIITIPDKTAENFITLSISCKDSGILKEFEEAKWQLITLRNQDSGLNAAVSEDYQLVNQIIPAKNKLRIEIIKKSIRPEIVGYYIEKKYAVNELKNQSDNITIESEFISEFETFGGYVQIYQANSLNNNSIWMKAETLDDPSVEPKVGFIALNKLNPFLSIGFSDHKGLTHAWKVLIRHTISTFPIIYWVGEPSLP